MFDLSKAIEFVSTGFGGTAAMPHQAPDLVDLLTSAGIEPSQLSGLAENEILTVLSENGIDPAAIAGSQLDVLLTSHPQAGELPDQLTGLLSDRLRF